MLDDKEWQYYNYRKFSVFVLPDAISILSAKDTPLFRIHIDRGITLSDEIIESMLEMDIKKLKQESENV